MSKQSGKNKAPFLIHSSSATGGYHDTLSQFKEGVDITNAKVDTYGDFKHAPLQGPFSEKHVGGHQSRHHGTGSGEAYYIVPSADELRVYGADYQNEHQPRAVYYRDEIAKRPFNIKNVLSNTGSGPHEGPGNYDHNTQIVQTTGKTQNPRHFAENSEVYQQFPERKGNEGNVLNLLDGTGSLSLRNFALPTGSANKSVITNKFSAPGDRYTMSKGFLNPSGEEMSVYNTLPFRNENVRLNLRERLSRHTLPIHDDGELSSLPLHNVNRNGIRVLNHKKQFSRKVVNTDFTLTSFVSEENGADDVRAMAIDPEKQLLYWAADDDGAIYRINLSEGSSTPQRINYFAITSITDIKLDLINNEIYFATAGVLKKSSLDDFDNNIQTISTERSNLWNISLDIVEGSIYYSSYQSDHQGVYKINLLNNNVEEKVVGIPNSEGEAAALEIDKESGYIFLTGFSNGGRIFRFNIDGSGKKEILTGQTQLATMELDRVTKRVYFAGRSGHKKIEYMDYNGNDRTVWIDLDTSVPRFNAGIQGFAIDLSLGKAVWGPYSISNDATTLAMATLPVYYPDYRSNSQGLYKRYDNFFVQHPIPQSELGYSWIRSNSTSSISFGYQKDNNDTSLQTKSRYSHFGATSGFDPNTGMSTHQFSSSFGFTSWEMVRQTDKELPQYLRKNNLFSFHAGNLFSDNDNRSFEVSTIVSQSAVSTKFKPLEHTVNITGDNTNTEVKITNSYPNVFNTFSKQKSTDVNSRLGIQLTDRGTYYNTIKGYYTTPDTSLSSNPFSLVRGVKISEVIFPKDKSTYSSTTRSRTNYTEESGTGDNGYDKQYGKQNTFFHPTTLRSTETKNSFGFSTISDPLVVNDVMEFGSDLILPTKLSATNCIGLKTDNTNGGISFVFGQSGEAENAYRVLNFTFTVSGEVSIDFDFISGPYDRPAGLNLEKADSNEDLGIQYQSPYSDTWHTAVAQSDTGAVNAIIDNTYGINRTSYRNLGDLFSGFYGVGDFTGVDGGGGIDIRCRNDGVSSAGDPFVAGTKLRIVQTNHFGSEYDNWAIRNLTLKYTAVPDSTEHLAFFPLQTDGLLSFPVSSSYSNKVGELMVDKDKTAYTQLPVANQCYVESTSLVKDGVLSDYLERTTEKLSGINPWEDSYDDYREDFRGYAKDMSVLPEFVISDHLDEYFTNFNFNRSVPDYLRIIGGDKSKGEISLTTVENFFDRFVSTEPLGDYKELLKEHDNYDLKSMKIKVDAVKKLLPYNGFYPMTRTVQLGNLLSASFIENVTGKEKGESGYDTQGFQTFAKTLMSPGILYNSIKAGYGVSYPIYKTTPTTKVDRSGVDKNVYEGFHIESPPDYQIPFEALINPKGNIPENEDIIFTPSWTSTTPAAPAYDYTGQWTGKSKPQFQLGMHNFLAESVKFFLKDEKLVAHVSKEQGDGFSVDPGKTYYMDVVLRDNIKMDRMGTYSGTVTSSLHSYLKNPENRPMVSDYLVSGDEVYAVIGSSGSVELNRDSKINLYKNKLDGDSWQLLDTLSIPVTQFETGPSNLTGPNGVSSISFASGSKEMYVAFGDARDRSIFTSSQEGTGSVRVYTIKNDKFSNTYDLVTSSIHNHPDTNHSYTVGNGSGGFGNQVKIVAASDGYHLLTLYPGAKRSVNYTSKGGNGGDTAAIPKTSWTTSMLVLHRSSSLNGLREENLFHPLGNPTQMDGEGYFYSGYGGTSGWANSPKRLKTIDMVSASYTDTDLFNSSSMGGLIIAAGNPYYDNGGTYRGAISLFYSGSVHGTGSSLLSLPDQHERDFFGRSLALANSNTGPNRKFYLVSSTRGMVASVSREIGGVHLFTGSIEPNFTTSTSTGKGEPTFDIGRTIVIDRQYLTASGFDHTALQKEIGTQYANQVSVQLNTLKTSNNLQICGIGTNLSIDTSRNSDGQDNEVIIGVGTYSYGFFDNDANLPRTEPFGDEAKGEITYNHTGSVFLVHTKGNGYVDGVKPSEPYVDGTDFTTTGLKAGNLSWVRFNSPNRDFAPALHQGVNRQVANFKVISGSSNPYSTKDNVFVFTPAAFNEPAYHTLFSGQEIQDIGFFFHTGSAFHGINQYTGSINFDGNPIPNPHFTSSVEIKSDFTYRKDGALYGQAIDNAYDPAYCAYTPPSYYGTSIARVSYTAPDQGAEGITLEQIFRESKIEELFELEDSRAAKFYSNSQGLTDNQKAGLMPITSSVELFGIRAPRINDELLPSNKQWVVGMRFESPVLDFETSDTEHASKYEAQNDLFTGLFNFVENSSHLPPRSMWTSYGSIPQDERGITLEIKESFSTFSDTEGSLVKLCDFKPESKNIGQVGESKEISEAILLIPFYKGAGNGSDTDSMKKYFNITDTENQNPARIDSVSNFVNNNSLIHINGTKVKSVMKDLVDQKELDDSDISRMVEGMSKYILPPHLDLLTKYKKTGECQLPFAMYFIEVTHELDQQDLSNIWQGVMPKVARRFESVTEEVVSQMGADNSFFDSERLKDSVDNDLSFMIFKVKKRAEKNYFKVTNDSRDDTRFQFDFDGDGEAEAVPDYSYNWPYDFFSLIETAKVTLELELRNDDSDTDDN